MRSLPEPFSGLPLERALFPLTISTRTIHSPQRVYSLTEGPRIRRQEWEGFDGPPLPLDRRMNDRLLLRVHQVAGDVDLEGERNGEDGDVVAFQTHGDRSIASDGVQVHQTAVHDKNAWFERFFGVSGEHGSEMLRAKLIAALERIDGALHELHTGWKFPENGEGLDDQPLTDRHIKVSQNGAV